MRWALRGAIVLALTACAPLVPPPASRFDLWERDLKVYQEQLQRFITQARTLREDFQALRADSHFAAMEAKIRDLAVRSAGGGDETDTTELIVATLYTMTLGELLVFPRFLDLSTRWTVLDATKSELESLRLDLWVRWIALERQSLQIAGIVRAVGMPAGVPPLVEQPITPLLSCITYVVGRLAFVNCS